ncbi:MAG: TerB family tellurite resistance protein [Deltaproteobacteria bacterium]|nr:TerB family tellurite resistance protein [Deltaproteobacteria bacterium]
MLDKLKSLLGNSPGGHVPPPPEEPVAWAAILLEVAESDNEFAPPERERIMTLLAERFALSRPEVETLFLTAREARAASTDLWPFTHALARAYGPEEKQRLLAGVWQVIFADGRLDPYEEQFTRRLQAMLSVNHSVLMAAKQEAREATLQAITPDPK